MNNLKSPPAARVSAANALLDRGYGKPPQHIMDESARSYVVRVPEVAKSTEAWLASVRAERRLPSDQASSKPEERIEGQKSDYLLLEAEKPVAD
jgi:hypothetical protein